jgi:hypothetical protein
MTTATDEDMTLGQSDEPLSNRLHFRESDHAYRLAHPCSGCWGEGIVPGARPGTMKKCSGCKGEGVRWQRIPSVTTILGMIAKPALISWAARIGAEAVRDWLAELEGSTVTVDADLIDRLYSIACNTHTEAKERAAEKGSAVHDAIHQYHENFFEADVPQDEEAARAWHAFLDWLDGSGLEVVATEQMVVGPKARYAGRYDLLMREKRHPSLHWVVDIKTSGGVYVEHVLQNAAYATAVRADRGLEIAGTLVLHVPSGADKATPVARSRSEYRGDFRLFNAALALYESHRTVDKAIRSILAA